MRQTAFSLYIVHTGFTGLLRKVLMKNYRFTVRLGFP